jgi:hypothetical protein
VVSHCFSKRINRFSVVLNRDELRKLVDTECHGSS